MLIAGFVIANVFSQLMAAVRAYLANYMVRNLDFSMMAGFFKHTMSLPFSFFAKRKTGNMVARLYARVAAQKEAMETEERQHARRLAEGTSRLAAGQQAQASAARTNLADARRARDEATKYERLFALPGGGGVSQLQVEGRRMRCRRPRTPCAWRNRA